MVVGGLVAYNYGAIINSYNTGTLSGSGVYLGGLVGYNGGSISGATNIGVILGTGSYIGGFIGFNAEGSGGSISNCAWWTGSYSYAVGNLPPTQNNPETLESLGWGTDENSPVIP